MDKSTILTGFLIKHGKKIFYMELYNNNIFSTLKLSFINN
jgi:hypothetical protein